MTDVAVTGPERVLVVDDDRLSQRMLARLLEQLDFVVETADDGDAALARIAAGPIDLVLLDVLMPGIDGVETLRRIRGNAPAPPMPVIMVSGLDDLDAVVDCIRLGATDYLPKPFEPALLVARVRSSLAAKRLHDVELDHLEQIETMTAAAAALDAGAFEARMLTPVANRSDALGQLARTFARMAADVAARETALRSEVARLRVEVDASARADRVAEITTSEYFQHLREQSDALKDIIGRD